MERLASTATTSCAYVSWEEVPVSSEKGRREVRYYLKRKDGSSDLAIVGKEKSSRHISYRHAIGNEALLSKEYSSPLLKLKSRKEVIDWLNLIVSDSLPEDLNSPSGVFCDFEDGAGLDIQNLKDYQLRKLGFYTKEFLWLGSPWTCRKKRKHYKSFSRNGVKISVYDFVYVLAEEDKRLVAYLEDMYEDSKGNKMVVVRWFHKVDEVGIVLPHSFSDREIFFSLCLQDLSIECIDGLATVLSALHFEKFQKESMHTLLEPFVCNNQFDNDDVKPFDITQVKGYWKQGLLGYMYTQSSSKCHGNAKLSDGGLENEGNLKSSIGIKPRKRQRLFKIDGDSFRGADVNFQNMDSYEMGICSKNGNNSLKKGGSIAVLASKDRDQNIQFLTVGSEVEVLSQDSGLRGCWFRALIIKRHKNKVKVQYRDIQDAVDESNKLEEWIPATKVAVPDHLGLRMFGRSTLRPVRPCGNQGKILDSVDVGSIVDIWWHDGWWEGIVVQKKSGDKFHVYFPGEKLESTFGLDVFRQSQEWYGNNWTHMKGRNDLVSSIISSLETRQGSGRSCDGKSTPVSILDMGSASDSDNEKAKEFGSVIDLSKDDMLAQLRWNSSRKRKRSGLGDRRKSPGNRESPSNRFMIPRSLPEEHEDYKYRGESTIFSSSVVSSLTNLVMCR